uniref:Secreted protein n=1 Tax=Panagrellus redivivus TaxID=6233 RepID=A0A7E4VUH6_PANRE
MKFLQLLCIALLLSAILAAPQAAPNATEADASLKFRDEKIAEFKAEIEKMQRDGKFKDRGWIDIIPGLLDVAEKIVDKVVKAVSPDQKVEVSYDQDE